MKDLTLCFLVRPGQVLLAMKKRGFGEGRYNGVGGKVEAGETIAQAAIRELSEEIEVGVFEENLKPHGSIKFHFDDDVERILHVHIFLIENWHGDPSETEEMKPKWFDTDAIPYETMWLDDPHWLPQVLAGETVSGDCYFTSFGAQGGELRDVQLTFS